MSDRITRRQVLAAGTAATIAAVAADAPAAAASAPSDGELLRRTLRVEQLVVWVYERVLAQGTMGPQARSVAATLLAQERAHVVALERELAGRGGSLEARWTLASARQELARHHIAASLTALGTQHDCLRLLVDTESVAEGAWFAAIGALRDPRLATLGAQIMACEAQHWTVISGISHHQNVKLTVPYPFVRGSSGY